jgi:hypothetical protein
VGAASGQERTRSPRWKLCSAPGNPTTSLGDAGPTQLLGLAGNDFLDGAPQNWNAADYRGVCLSTRAPSKPDRAAVRLEVVSHAARQA